MGVAAVVTKRTDLARPLKVLVPMIKEELEAGDQAGIEHYMRAGEMLLEAKEQVAHGDWKGWIDRNFHLSYSSAKRYMLLADLPKRSTREPFTSLREALRETSPTQAGGQNTWQEPVKQVLNKVNYEALRQEDLKRAQGRELERKLGLQLIDIGFKVLAQKLHPDKKGGSHDGFIRLKSVRDRLKQAV